MKLTKTEKKIIEGRRKFIRIKRASEKITRYRKGAKQSRGEAKVAAFLKSERIEYNTEWWFKGLYNYAKSCLLYFDFYVPEFNLCIEYDGQQHYGSKKTEAEKMNDFLKNAYCVKNRIFLLRIKYTDFDNIENLICSKIDQIQPIKKTKNTQPYLL